VEFRAILEDPDSHCSDSREQLVDLSVAAHESLKAASILDSLLLTMEQIRAFFNAGALGTRASDTCAAAFQAFVDLRRLTP
jgi:hypothetical protein